MEYYFAVHACPYTISESGRYRVDTSPHYDTNGTLDDYSHVAWCMFFYTLVAACHRGQGGKSPIHHNNKLTHQNLFASRFDNCPDDKVLRIYEAHS